MQQVITAEQAKQITKGRTPLVPIEYEQACTSLAACLTLDEAKYWSDKSDALAAYAKIYRDEKLQRDAKALKIKAYRRMGELAREIRPVVRSNRGSSNGPVSLLKEQGLKQGEAIAASRLAKLPKEKIEHLVNLSYPPSPILASRAFAGKGNSPHSTPWGSHEQWIQCWKYVGLMHSVLTFNPTEMGRSVRPDVAAKVKAKIQPVIEWLDAFDSAVSRGLAQPK